MRRYVQTLVSSWFGDRRPRFAVLLHATNLLMTDDTGVERLGGAYTWCDVPAADAQQAVEIASEELIAAPAFADEVRNRDSGAVTINAEKVIRLARFGKKRATGIVFYVSDGSDEE